MTYILYPEEGEYDPNFFPQSETVFLNHPWKTELASGSYNTIIIAVDGVEAMLKVVNESI